MTMAECEARYAAVCASGRHPLRGECPESMRGTILEGNGVPGLLIRPREGRAVVFWHGEDAGSCPEAWHAPTCVEEGSSDKWLVTFFKVPLGAKPKLKQATEETIMPGGLDPYAAVGSESGNARLGKYGEHSRHSDDSAGAKERRRDDCRSDGEDRAQPGRGVGIYPARNSRLSSAPARNRLGRRETLLPACPVYPTMCPGSR